MFNLFNHPQLGPEGGLMSGLTFGVATAMANSNLGAAVNSGAGFNPIFNMGAAQLPVRHETVFLRRNASNQHVVLTGMNHKLLPVVGAVIFCVLFPVVAACAQAVAHSPAAVYQPKIFSSFDAVSGNPAMSYKDHPDMALAACSGCGATGQVLVATGQDIAIYDTSGKLLKMQSTENFIKAAGIDFDAWKSRPALPLQAAGKVNDPRATYDPSIGRWIVVCSCSGDFLIVSGSKDATGAWKGVALTDSAGDLTMFPGWDKNGVYIAEFQLKLNSQVIALPAADVAWEGRGNISLAHKAVFNDRPYEMRPAVDPNAEKKPGDPEYLIARSGPPQTAMNVAMDLLVDRITWSDKKATISGPTSISTGFLYNTPIPMPQPSGPPVRGNESHRVFSVSAHGGHLYLVEASGPCASDCGTQGQDSNNLFYWFDIDAKTMTLKRKTKVSDATLSLLFPTMALDGRGNAGIGVTGGSSSEHPSIYLFMHLASDSAGKINGPFPAHRGTDAYTCDKGRDPATVGWGTYSATVQDGSDPMKLWTLQEYAGSANPCVWKTRVVGFHVQSEGTQPLKPKRGKRQ
jgi:hypothetical protein